MPEELPRLGGIATKDLVEHIGTGSFKASYINWSRTMELLRKHAPGWMVEIEYNKDGEVLHRSPIGAELMLRFRHLDGTTTTSVPQAVMDNRNNSIPYEKITSRDVTDTHRRGSCLLAAFQFGLAYELWAKMPLESGYQVADEETIELARQASKVSSKPSASSQSTSPDQVTKEVTEVDFMAACTKINLSEAAAKSLIPKLKGDFANGIKTLAEKDAEFVAKMNAKFQSSPGEAY
ncbi:MAG: hypothetical protein ACO24P_00200 [Candidatus Nanopelagicaceae bacterium]